MKVEINIESFSFVENKPFLSDINIDLNQEITALIGLSGIGKSTLMNIILSIHEGYLKGHITYYYNSNIVSFKRIVSEGLVGFQSQENLLLPWLNIKQNLYVPARLNPKLKVPDGDVLRDILESLNLEQADLLKFPHELSFGMRSRFGFIRCLLYKPKYLFLDELFTGLDTISSNLIANELKSYTKNNNAIVLSISHDIERSIKIADKIIIINNSRQLIIVDKPFNSESIIKNLIYHKHEN